MNRLLAFALLLLGANVNASHYFIKWDRDWDIGVMQYVCTLSRKYSSAAGHLRPNSEPGDLTIFDTFHLKFVYPIIWRNNEYPDGNLHLFLITTADATISTRQWRINSARINGIEFKQLQYNWNETQLEQMRNFSLNNAESIGILKALNDGDSPILELELSNGKQVTLNIPEPTLANFGAWVRMLSACAEVDLIH